MATEAKTIGIDPLEQADAAAVYRHAVCGEPLDLEVARRVHERASKVTEEIHRVHGIIDDAILNELLRDEDDDDL